MDWEMLMGIRPNTRDSSHGDPAPPPPLLFVDLPSGAVLYCHTEITS